MWPKLKFWNAKQGNAEEQLSSMISSSSYDDISLFHHKQWCGTETHASTAGLDPYSSCSDRASSDTWPDGNPIHASQPQPVDACGSTHAEGTDDGQAAILSHLVAHIENLRLEIGDEKYRLEEMTRSQEASASLVTEIQNLLNAKAKVMLEKERLERENCFLVMERAFLCQHLGVNSEETANLTQLICAELEKADRCDSAERRVKELREQVRSIKEELRATRKMFTAHDTMWRERDAKLRQGMQLLVHENQALRSLLPHSSPISTPSPETSPSPTNSATAHSIPVQLTPQPPSIREVVSLLIPPSPPQYTCSSLPSASTSPHHPSTIEENLQQYAFSAPPLSCSEGLGPSLESSCIESNLPSESSYMDSDPHPSPALSSSYNEGWFEPPKVDLHTVASAASNTSASLAPKAALGGEASPGQWLSGLPFEGRERSPSTELNHQALPAEQ